MGLSLGWAWVHALHFYWPWGGLGLSLGWAWAACLLALGRAVPGSGWGVLASTVWNLCRFNFGVVLARAHTSTQGSVCFVYFDRQGKRLRAKVWMQRNFLEARLPSF